MARPKKEKKVILNTLPSDEESKKKIKGAIQELVDSMTRMQSERELIKEIGTTIEETVGFSKKALKKLANIQFKANRTQVEGETNDILDAYDVLFPTKQ